MRVLYYTSTFFSDCDFPLVKALAASGVDVVFLLHVAPYSVQSPIFRIRSLKDRYGIFPATEYPELYEWREYLDLNKTFIVNDPKGKTARIVSNLSLLHSLRSFVETVDPDIVHIVEMPFVLQNFVAKRYKTIYTLHDPIPHDGADNIIEETARRLSVKKGSSYILLNRFQDTAFCARYGVRKERLFHSKLGPYECSRNLLTGNSPKYKYILFFGRISKYKGIEYAVRAFKAISPRFPDVSFIIAGGGGLYFDDDIESFPNIILINRYLDCSEIADLVSGSQFVVCPYISATQSGVVQTAYSFSKPIIATSVGNISEVVEHEKTGLVVSPKDVDMLSEAMAELLSSPQMLEAMSAEISERNKSGVSSWTNIAAEYCDIYDKISGK